MMKLNIQLLLLLLVTLYLSGCSGNVTKPGDEEVANNDNVPGMDIFYILSHTGVDKTTRHKKSNDQGTTETSQISETDEEYEDLWCRIRDGYGIDVEENEQIRQAIRQYVRYPNYIEKVSFRAKPYLYHIVREVERRNLPLEIALLPVIESSFEPMAVSSSSAAGIWQFTPGTGKHFGLRQNRWYDGRRDIIASTDAALDYLQKLYEMFDGDWPTALAAYNYGEGNVLKAIGRNEARGRPTDFWSLDLPRETRQFVPKLIAVAKIVANPEKYGVVLHNIADAPYFKQVRVGNQVNLNRAAQLAGLSPEEIKRLNPGYRHSVTAAEGNYCIVLPIEKAKKFEESIRTLSADRRLPKNEVIRLAWEEDSRTLSKRILSDTEKQIIKPEKRVTKAEKEPQKQKIDTEKYRVTRGDTLASIAKRHNITVATLQELNDFKAGRRVYAGQRIKVPVSEKNEEQKSEAKESSKAKTVQATNTYSVKVGDTLHSIASRHQVSVEELRRLNKLKGNKLSVGNKLNLPSDSVKEAKSAKETKNAKKAEDKRKIVHTVKGGENLWRIAKSYQISVEKLTQWNESLRRNPLKLGQKLTIWSDS